ncbi:MAG: DUF1800 domain-containing protein [Bacteroidota bacterium]
MRRTTFGPTKAEIQQVTEQGLEATILQLFEDIALPEPPVYYDTEEGDDINVPLGESWVDAPLPLEGDPMDNRRRSIRAWTVLQMLEEGISIRETLTLFWHNHFAIDNRVNDPRFWYRYITTIRTYAWGNFRQLVKDITVDPCMLRFLNGNQNEAGSPNENYARELLELYTVGKGPAAGPGDYTTFTEQDVQEMARILTGWADSGYKTDDPEVELGSYFNPDLHDIYAKQLSDRFGAAIVTDLGEEEYSHLIDIIFGQNVVAEHICRKLYRWFVYYKVDEATELSIIAPMAQMLIDNDYEIGPVVQTLLQSDHFFSFLNQGPMIKHPIQYVLSPIKSCTTALSEELQLRYETCHELFRALSNMDMEYFHIPEVAGWKAYYQQPLYYRQWINAITLHQRSGFVRKLLTNGFLINEETEERFRLDVLSFIATLDNPMDVNAMIAEITALLLPQPLSEGQLFALKELLIPGLPDFEWTLEYGNYLGEPENEELREAVERKLQDFFSGLFNMAEFHLS